jgi:response regulator RpfG family c-di-GMP phosphodiesterase
VLVALVDALEPRDRDGRTHSMRVSNLAAHVAAEIGVEAEAANAIQTAARIHDIGRVALLDEGLRRLSAAGGEADAPALAVRILAPLQRFPVVAEVVAFQQERGDGGGRPAGLAGAAIPLGARILAAANRCDEITHGPDGLPVPGADPVATLRAAAGTQLDPEVVEALVKVLERRD